MQNNTQTMVKGFSDAFYCLPHNQLKAVKKAICSEMGWAEPTFNSKRNGSRELKNPERIVLRSIFEGYGIEF